MLPELKCNWNRIDVVPLPPGGLATGSMQLSMVDAANWHEELIAHSAPERARLCESEVMRIGRQTAADETCLSQHVPPVFLIAQANYFS